MKTALLAILLFCVMIFPHELGHFIAAKKMGIKVNEFAFGMGPTIWKKQKGETLHSIRLFPIGGFCAMEGEDEEAEDPRAFSNKKPWQKIVVLSAGSIMNILSALLIMILVVGILGFTTNTIDSVTPDSPAFKAELMAGDEITAVGGNETDTWTDVTEAILGSEGQELTFEIDRDGEQRTVKLTPQMEEDGRYIIGITSRISHNPAKAVIEGTKATWNMTKAMFQTIGQLFTGKVGADELSGPVGMVNMVSQTSQYGLWYYGFLTALICLNLAIINMLPLPALDGGRILFALYTMITGRQVSQKVEGAIHFTGILLLFALMIYVTFNDIIKIFG